MSKNISFRDLLKVDSLKGHNEITLLHPSMDSTIYPMLEEIGFDTDYAIVYYPANHRDMEGKIAIGFIACGEIDINRKHLRAIYTDNITRLAARSYTDRSLTTELANLSGSVLDFRAFTECGIGDDESEFFEELIEEDWKEKEAQIKQLAEIRDVIRGPMFNASGAPKTQEEYAEYFDSQQYYEERHL